jgi:AMMECR1 domain-containing protein
MLTKKEVELTEQYFISTDTFSKVRIKWRAFTKVEAGKQGIYLFMESPLAVIIPKSAFENEVQVDKFINYVNERIKVNADMGFSF